MCATVSVERESIDAPRIHQEKVILQNAMLEKKSHVLKKFETFLCTNFQKFETFICAIEVRQRAIEQVLQRSRHVRGQRKRLDTHQELVGAAIDRDGARRVPSQLASGQQRSDVVHALVHDGTQLRELPERPVALQHEAKRAQVCQVQERQRIVPLRLQRIRKAAECTPGQLPIETEQRQRRVACVEGRLAARAGEAQRVARQRLAAHDATQGTHALRECVVYWYSI
jgi:hypothetical protein